MAFLPFNVSDYEPLEEFKPLPVGYYTAIITESDLAPTKNGSGQYIKMVFEVVDADYAGRKIFHNINIVNANSDAERIGRQELATLTSKLGVGQVSDTIDLHGKPVKVYVTIEEYNGKYQNRIHGAKYKSASESVNAPTASAPAATAPAPATTPAPAPTPSAGGVPWRPDM